VITFRGKTYGVGSAQADAARQIASRMSTLLRRPASELRDLAEVMLGAYREAVTEKGLPRWDPRVKESKGTAQYVQAQAGTDYLTAFTFCSVVYSLAKEAVIKPGVWDPVVADKQSEARTRQLVSAVRQMIAPATEGAKQVGTGVFSAVKPILLLGAIGLAAIVAVKFLPKPKGA
jgi:hypothetical protein